MKAIKWKVFLISGICIALGLVFLISGMILGGSPGYGVGYNNTTNKLEIRRNVNGTKNVVKVDKRKQDRFENVDLDVDFMNIEVERSDDYYIEYTYAAGELEPLAKVEHNTLVFRQNPQSFSNVISFFNMGFTVITAEEIYVKLYVPEDCEFDSFQVSSSGGGISMQGDYKADEITLSSDFGKIIAGKLEANSVSLSQSSGNINVSAIQGKDIFVDSDFGRIQLDEVDGDFIQIDSNGGAIELKKVQGDTLNIHSDFGGITLSNAVLSGDVDLSVNSGGVNLSDVVCRDMKIDTDFGAIKGDGIEVANLSVGSTSGGINMKALSIESADIDTDFGGVELDLVEKEDAYSYDLDVDFGSLHINGAKQNSNYMREVQDGKPLRVESNSGSITIRTK